jgi:hypothetical protein
MSAWFAIFFAMSELPVIDVFPLVTGSRDRSRVSSEIASACRDSGFFYIVGHGVDERLQRRLEDASRRFFAQDLETKMEIAMVRGGRAWRGYFPVGAELTSGKADLKEGIYFGAELPPDHPRVKDGTPLHGPNLFTGSVPELREAVLGYVDAMTRLGHALMEQSPRASGSRSRISLTITPRNRSPCFESSTIQVIRRCPAMSRVGVSASTPTTGCSPSSSRTTLAGCR